MSGFLLAIDQGTTGSTVLVLGPDARILARETVEFPQHYPKPAWVEHDVEEIWASVRTALARALAAARVDPKSCIGIGITNQRETTVLFERATSRAVHRAIVWQDRRTAERCEALRRDGHQALFRERTGLVLDPYFSGTKLEWILDAVPFARARADRGELAFGTIDTFLIHRLSGGVAHVTDVTNASRTLLLDIRSGRWDSDLCRILRVPESVLPEVVSSSGIVARTKGLGELPDGIPIAGIAGDQQAALFGQACFAVGDAKCTYGTGAFLLMNVGHEPVASKHGLLTTIAWGIDGELEYALEGSAFIAGAAVQWLRDGLGIIRSSSEVESRAREVEDAGDVVFVPALAGLGAPHWDPHARGLLSGLTRDTTAAHICRAVLDGIAFEVADLVRAMESDSGKPLGRLRVDGGASANDLMMQFQSDILGAIVDRPRSVETTALGAAYLAGLGVGLFTDRDAVAKSHAIERTFAPRMSESERDRRLSRWSYAVARARSDAGRTA